MSRREEVKRALEILWGEGNAVGLDGWVGPDRGEEPDPEATIYRRREVRRALAIIEAMLAQARAEALREMADDLASVTHGRTSEALSHWTDHDRGIYELAIEEASGKIHDRADALEAGEGRG